MDKVIEPRPTELTTAADAVTGETSEGSDSGNVLVPLYEHQTPAVDELMQRMQTMMDDGDRARAVFVAPTGFGKTECLTTKHHCDN